MSHPVAHDHYPSIDRLDRANVCMRISLALQGRSKKRWSVRGGAGGSQEYGRLTISSPPDRRPEAEAMTDADRQELTQLLGLDELVGPEGAIVEDSHEHWIAFIDRAEGRVPRLDPEPLTW